MESKKSPLSRHRTRTGRLSERFYNRIWEGHLKPMLDNPAEKRTLVEIIESLPESVAPLEGRMSLYQAMARRDRGDIKRLDVPSAAEVAP